jgi:hypothetical protein
MSHAYARVDHDTLSIGNVHLERRLAVAQHQPCITNSLVIKLSGRDYSRPGSHEFSFAANGKPLTTRDSTVTHDEIREGDPAGAVVFLQTTDRLSAELHSQVYAHGTLLGHRHDGRN